MNRCGRLFRKRLIECGMESEGETLYESKLQSGDIQTGFKIIAGLPIEEQICSIYAHEIYKHEYDMLGLMDALERLYVWNGEKWEKYDGD